MSVETTFAEDIDDPEQIRRHLLQLLRQALNKLAENQLFAYNLTIKIKYQNFVQITHRRTLLALACVQYRGFGHLYRGGFDVVGWRYPKSRLRVLPHVGMRVSENFTEWQKQLIFSK